MNRFLHIQIPVLKLPSVPWVCPRLSSPSSNNLVINNIGHHHFHLESKFQVTFPTLLMNLAGKWPHEHDGNSGKILLSNCIQTLVDGISKLSPILRRVPIVRIHSRSHHSCSNDRLGNRGTIEKTGLQHFRQFLP